MVLILFFRVIRNQISKKKLRIQNQSLLGPSFNYRVFEQRHFRHFGLNVDFSQEILCTLCTDQFGQIFKFLVHFDYPPVHKTTLNCLAPICYLYNYSQIHLFTMIWLVRSVQVNRECTVFFFGNSNFIFHNCESPWRLFKIAKLRIFDDTPWLFHFPDRQH